MKKILNKIVISMISIIMCALSILNVSAYAISNVNANEVNLYSKGVCTRYLKYNGMAIKVNYVVYNDGGAEYPAYCLNVDLPGVSEEEGYSVSTKEKLTDVAIWRVIINGYPYKSLEELGVSTKEEAYTATKQAIYCALYNRDVNTYEANGEKGENTFKALKKIIENASKDTSTQVANTVTIVPDSNSWVQDELNSNYVSKVYQVKANATITNYTITSNGDLPEGAKITDTSNNEKSTYKAGEKFKVLIPISSLINDGDFSLNVETKMDTKPVIYGKATIDGVQNYALTAYSYEDATGKYSDNYVQNKTKIKIIKQDKETKELLSNVEFEVLDENLNVAYSGLLTDENGEITLENVLPGKYYIKEVNSLQGYELNEELLEISVNFGEELTVTVNNIKEETEPQEEVATQKNIEFTPEVVKKLPVTGM
jgi:TQXA domain-containing protein